MKVLRIEPLKKGRYAVHVLLGGEECTIPLYRAELSAYHIEEEAELLDSVYEKICQQVLIKRAVSRAEYLLGARSYTTQELKKKLREGYYPKEIIDRVIELLTEYGFLDDISYAARYIESRGSSKSIRQLRAELLAKGIERDIIDKELEDGAEREMGALKKLVEKRCKGVNMADPKEYARQMRFFLSKGFPLDAIRQELGRYGEEFE